MKILVTGGNGMLGRTLRQVIEAAGDQFICADLPEWDITAGKDFAAGLRSCQPDWVIHCAAMTAVDLCESHPDKAFSINECGSENVALACRECGSRLLAVSTDYVFSGRAGHPYSEDDPAGDALNVYGRSKYAGEEAVRKVYPEALICRLGWLYGDGGPSFPHTMLKLAADLQRPIRVVDDQRGNPTSALAAARAMMMLMHGNASGGVWHLTCEGEATWAEFARELYGICGIEREVIPVSTSEYPRPAARPADSRLEKNMLKKNGFPMMPHWKAALEEACQIGIFPKQ